MNKNVKIVNKLIQQEHINAALTPQGWKQSSLGQVRSNGVIKEKTGFILYTRKRLLDSTLMTTLRGQSSTTDSDKPHKQAVSEAGSNAAIGIQKLDLTPMPALGYDVGTVDTTSASVDNSLPQLSSLTDYASLAALRTNSPCLLSGFDTEWQSAPVRQDMISWQFAVVYDCSLVEFLFIRAGEKDLSLSDALGIILDTLGDIYIVMTGPIISLILSQQTVSQKLDITLNTYIGVISIPVVTSPGSLLRICRSNSSH